MLMRSMASGGRESLGAVDIPYYVVPKGKRSGYWRPTKRMKELGFSDVRCGPDGPSAWAIAQTWNARWQATRRGHAPPPIEAAKTDRTESEIMRRYPPNSVGAAFQAYIRTDEWKKHKAASTRNKIWWPAWFRIREMWGDVDPNTITFQQMSEWRGDLERAVSRGVAHKTFKVWRALWVVMSSMKIARTADPSLGVRNKKPAPRGQSWREGEAAILAKTAWRSGYKGLACIIAISWDTLFSPVDVRSLRAKHRCARTVTSVRSGKTAKVKQRFFDCSEEGRAKTGRPAVGTIGPRTTRLIDAYLKGLGLDLLPETILFRNRSGAPYRDDTLCDDFADVRALAFPGDKRRLMDMRRSGTMEAVAGGAEGMGLASKLANSIDRSNELHKTYAPVDMAAVLDADEARRRGRKKMGGKNESW